MALWASASLTAWAAAAPLRIIHVAVHQIEDGPAVGDRASFVPGETVYLSFDVENYALTKEQSTSISWEVAAADPKGVPVAPPAEGKKQATLQPEDKNWLPRARQAVVLPNPAPGGAYTIHIKVTDQNSKESAVADTKFTVAGPDLPPAPALLIRNFGFYRTEEEPRSLSMPVYRSGDTLYARFQIAGYKYGTGNAIEVTYGIAVLGPAGNVMYTQDPALEEKSASFYPKPYIDATMSLALNPGTKSGNYTLRITARDKVGNQTAETRNVFQVE